MVKAYLLASKRMGFCVELCCRKELLNTEVPQSIFRIGGASQRAPKARAGSGGIFKLLNRWKFVYFYQSKQNLSNFTSSRQNYWWGYSPGGGGLSYKKGGDASARREISNEPLKGTNLGVA